MRLRRKKIPLAPAIFKLIKLVNIGWRCFKSFKEKAHIPIISPRAVLNETGNN